MNYRPPQWWLHQDNPPPEILLVRSAGFTHKLLICDILFLRAEHVYVHFYLAGERQLLQRGSLAATLARLPAETFLRVHRGYAINLRAVSSWNREAVFFGRHRVPISRSRRTEVLRRLEGI